MSPREKSRDPRPCARGRFRGSTAPKATILTVQRRGLRPHDG